MLKMPAVLNRMLPASGGVTQVTYRRDLAGRRGDTEPPHSRARFDAAAASADAAKKQQADFPGRFFLNRVTIWPTQKAFPSASLGSLGKPAERPVYRRLIFVTCDLVRLATPFI